jgi:hypothetical protein
LDNILEAMKGHRIFERFGFNLAKSVNQIVNNIQLVTEYENWTYNASVSDWVNNEEDEVLSGYYAPEELLQMLEFQVDVELE